MTMSHDERGEVLRALGAWHIEPITATRLNGGAVNEHWQVEATTGETTVLRRYRERHAPESADYEHRVLAFLAERDWPVAAPIPAGDGSTIVVTDAGRWSLFPYLPGEPPPRDDLKSLLRKGALLALLHADLQEWDDPGQRPTFSRVTDLDTYVRPDGFDSYDALIEWYEGVDAERAAALERARERNRERLDVLGYDELPDAVIYNECLGNNVLFEGDTVTGILDFDFVHRDARIADIGRSLAIDCGADEERVRYWLTGYTAHADPRLSAREAFLLPSMMIANEIWNAVVPLSIAARTGETWMIESARASIDERLPRLEAAQSDLRRLASAVAGHPQHGSVEP